MAFSKALARWSPSCRKSNCCSSSSEFWRTPVTCAALIADRTMAKFGLQGKSFIPLLSAYACAVPAIMATRTIENKRDRIATILIAPFMTCSARFPVYMLIVAAFVPNQTLLGPLVSKRTAAMVGLYVLGFAVAVLTARV